MRWGAPTYKNIFVSLPLPLKASKAGMLRYAAGVHESVVRRGRVPIAAGRSFTGCTLWLR